jgi:hypothetical protein
VPQGLELRRHLRGRARCQTGLNICLLHPLQQGMGRTAKLADNRRRGSTYCKEMCSPS